MNNKPIGVFDSGIGGLTVYKELQKVLPEENFVYFGDTARLPYGSKSKNTVLKFSIQIVDFLIQQKAKLIVIGCNTASSTAYNHLIKSYDIPLIDVIRPTVRYINSKYGSSVIGIIGTIGTINSGTYESELWKLNKKLKIYKQSCPLFVPLVENGWQNTDVAVLIAEKYLNSIKKKPLDVLILGCTHYPLLRNTIKKVIRKTDILNSGKATALEVKKYLHENDIENKGRKKPLRIMLSDVSENTKKTVNTILKKEDFILSFKSME